MSELEELRDLQEMLKSCVDNMNSSSEDFNLELVIFLHNIKGMPVFVVIEGKITECIENFYSKERSTEEKTVIFV